MKIDILTLFPDFFSALDSYGVIGRAIEKGILEINRINIRDFSEDKHRKVDDLVFGGSSGMLMTPQPLFDSIDSVKRDDSTVIYLSPQGKVLNQEICMSLAGQEHLILLCGHYEGIDQRVIDERVDEEISIGDYVLTGGEIPAMVLLDAVARQIPGTLGNEESPKTDSHYDILLQYDEYTRPRDFRGLKVPEVLFSGNHKLIEDWQRNSALENTRKKRPDLYEKYLNQGGKDGNN